MLKPEIAQKQLETWSIDENDDFPLQHLLPHLKKLPKKLRDVCFGLNECNAKGEQDYEDSTTEFVEAQGKVFAKLTRADRKKILKTLFGDLAVDIDSALTWITHPENSQHHLHGSFRRKLTKHEQGEKQFEFVKQLMSLCQYDQSVLSAPWLAAWYGHMTGYYLGDEVVSQLLASVIDGKGKKADEVFEILCQSARKEHEIGVMGAHVCNSLLWASRPEGWELMEKMLLAAQRQEGLRQTILDSTRLAHPTAFIRMVNVIVENNLTRFSSVVLEFNHWFGMEWAAKAGRKLNQTLAQLLPLLERPAAALEATSSTDPELAFFGLWALAFSDVESSLKPCQKLLKSNEPELRYVAARHLACLDLPAAFQLQLVALKDEDLRVCNSIFEGGHEFSAMILSDELSARQAKQVFETLVELHERLPAKSVKLKSCVWPWTQSELSRNEVVSQMAYVVEDTQPIMLVPYMKSMESWSRAGVVRKLAESKKWDSQTRTTIFAAVGDTSADVRETALEAIDNVKITADEATQLEGFLTRTAADLRNGVVEVLANQTDKKALASAERLLLAKVKNQRLAGLELLRQLSIDERQQEACMELANTYQNSSKRKLGKIEQQQVDAILDSDRVVVSFDDCLGLMDRSKRSAVVPPKNHKVQAVTAATYKLLKSLDDLIHKHRADSFVTRRYGSPEELVLGEVSYGFPYPSWSQPIKKQAHEFPFSDLFMQWYKSLPASCKDQDGMELVRAVVYLRITNRWSFRDFEEWAKGTASMKSLCRYLVGKGKRPKLRYLDVLDDIACWLLRLNLPKKAASFAQDVSETVYSMVPRKELEALTVVPDKKDDDDEEEATWRDLAEIDEWSTTAVLLDQVPDVKRDKAMLARRWQLEHWKDEPVPGAQRNRPDLSVLAGGYLAKKANLADVYDHLIGPMKETQWGSPFSNLGTLCGRVVPVALREFASRPAIQKATTEIAARLLEIELGRGEAPTGSTDAALQVKAYRGIDSLHRLLTALGTSNFKKISSYRASTSDSREATFTEMISATFPAEDDTHQAFAKRMQQSIQEGLFPEERLIQLAFLAPQWTEFIEHTIQWKGFTEAIYWFMAHMKYVWGMDDAFASDEELEHEDDHDWDEDEDEEKDKPEKLTSWEKIIRQRTPLTDAERTEGAIDVAWFNRTYIEITPKRWEAMANAAKYAATSAQAKRARLIADVLLGKASRKELVDGIKKRHLKENVRLLGLIPAAKGNKAEKDIVERYEILQSYLKYANGLSSMSRPEALRACEIGMQNLAATAGFADPMRLQWAMEAASTRDIAKGPIVVKRGDVSATLSLDEHAQPVLEIDRAGKMLKSLPKTVRKDNKFVELRDRAKHLKHQAARVKQSLENAMCRGDVFTGGELVRLANHAILWPQLQRVVLVGEGIMGYPDKRGKALRNHAGKLEPVKKNEALRIAHPYDLLKSKQWSRWQAECFAHERIQPFKQVFRELYLVTAQEKKDKVLSNRYAGLQVNPRQAYALWGRRGWSVDEYENVWKSFHHEEINVAIHFNIGYTTPLEVEGLTIDKIEFTRRDDYRPIKITDVPPRLFSEVMRDMDLIVSVAHVGDVDPEATASTVEVRTSLLKETCQLLGMKNVKLKADRALIKGTLGQYSVHLGSGVVHQMPGGAVCLVPVHSQHRGRLFLPFADDDPRTAEVIAKTLLLARDEEIDDPILLEQLRR